MIDTLKERPTSPTPERAQPVPALSDKERAQAALAAFLRAEAGGHPVWWGKLREVARLQAGQLDFPNIRQEEWRFTNMAPALQLPLQPAAKDTAKLNKRDIERFGFDLDSYRMVFIDGHYCAALSALPADGDDLQLENLPTIAKASPHEIEKHQGRHADFKTDFFTALNTGFFEDGAFVSIAAGKTAAKPVHLLFIGASEQAGATVFPRSLIIAHPGARLKVIESHVSLSDAPRLSSAVTEIVIGAEAEVEHCKVQQESERAYHVAAIQAVLAKDSRWTSHSIALGGKVARNQVQALFGATGGVATLNGLFLGHADQLIDHHTVVDHAQPRCESHEFYHGILADRAHGVFNGKIFVRKDAQKTNAKQTNRNLLLSDSAVMDTKPQLEIYADDVKCTHGAAIGQLSEEAMFYLRARGIGADLARRMLIQAFASDVIERIGIVPVRAQLEKVLGQRFQPAKA